MSKKLIMTKDNLYSTYVGTQLTLSLPSCHNSQLLMMTNRFSTNSSDLITAQVYLVNSERQFTNLIMGAG